MTGDVWKFVYYLFQNYKDKISYKYYNNINYRGLLCLQLTDKFEMNIDSYDIINNYDYFKDFNDYLQILQNI